MFVQEDCIRNKRLREILLISENIKIEAKITFDSLMLNDTLIELNFAGIKFRSSRRFRENCKTQSLGRSQN